MMAAPTTKISALAAVLLCATAFLAADAASSPKANKADDPVAKACANVTSQNHSRYGGPGLTIEFCKSALGSEKRSAAARHPRDLALVAMDLVRSGAADAGAKVDGALRSAKRSKDTALTLRYCRQDYEAVVHTVSVCHGMVQEYDPAAAGRGHHSGDLLPYTYLECTDKQMNAAHYCWTHIFYDEEVKKAVWKEVEEISSRANLAKAMVEQMLGIVDDDD
ncbi:hypothetical protein BAE44_0006361 [Dichanthelium oligosanthes]|uniref:Pectinesterase inhibitor domain-containing protein n=1 Tax=Dichanthelium oligosanthes TaxID=888268 RepID=A0A1E5W5P5_9POAL|nr:hypothetical protein BAE44_0006361 [Dichanthelium oligosanthes]